MDLTRLLGRDQDIVFATADGAIAEAVGKRYVRITKMTETASTDHADFAVVSTDIATTDTFEVIVLGHDVEFWCPNGIASVTISGTLGSPKFLVYLVD